MLLFALIFWILVALAAVGAVIGVVAGIFGKFVGFSWKQLGIWGNNHQINLSEKGQIALLVIVWGILIIVILSKIF
ncbi:MAG TPA: hypothetical protein K8V00_06555 [Ligilactobacillus acidipiscis]|uniref:Uncharacterized protein n=1 Tax=Ligilactobacillus acidipiscis TaxID=89059 RepID=A0A921F909_9LACO|nr:hypothetical protein [Ligilactobacillus acidipiscis]